jgi:hypothetical protein
VFDENRYLRWIVVGLLILIFGVPLIFLGCKVNEPYFKMRSPKLVLIGIVLLGLDAIFNTLIYSSDFDQDDWYKNCAFSIFVDQFIMYSITAVYLMRMYRIYKLYFNYNRYLSD